MGKLLVIDRNIPESCTWLELHLMLTLFGSTVFLSQKDHTFCSDWWFQICLYYVIA